jgi:hypothetical protein
MQLKERLPRVNLAKLTATDFLFLKWAAIVVAMVISLAIALLTAFGIHPDEFVHLGGFQYFEGRFFPPPIGSDDVVYSAYGQSRVFSRELVYIIYGNLAHLIQLLTGIQVTYLTYRLFNVALFLITLLIVFFTNIRKLLLPLFGFVLVSIPQVVYLYSYANSDAWAISFSIFTFLVAVYLWDQPVQNWKLRDFLLLGTLTGFVLVSKTNFTVSLLLPYSLVGFRALESFSQQKQALIRQWLPGILAWILAVLLIAAPLRIVYTLSQGNYQAAIDRVREERAVEGYKPSNPTSRGLHLKAKGYSYDYLLKRKWHQVTARSFWALYGGMSIRTRPRWKYRYVFYGAVILMMLTGFTLIKTGALWHDRFLAISIPVSIVTIILNIYASMRHSLHFDYQPQGRYLFPSLIPLSFLLLGTANIDPFPIKITRGLICTCLYSFALYSLLVVGIPRMLLK